MTYVTTVKELQDAVERKDEEIMVSADLAKKLKGIIKLKKLSKQQQTALIALIAGGGVGIGGLAIAVAAAPVTGGASLLAAAPLAAFAASAAGGASISAGVVAIIITLIAVVGVVTVVALLKDYDLEMAENLKETTFCFKFKK